ERVDADVGRGLGGDATPQLVVATGGAKSSEHGPAGGLLRSELRRADETRRAANTVALHPQGAHPPVAVEPVVVRGAVAREPRRPVPVAGAADEGGDVPLNSVDRDVAVVEREPERVLQEGSVVSHRRPLPAPTRVELLLQGSRPRRPG